MAGFSTLIQYHYSPGFAGLIEKIRDETSLVPDVNADWKHDENGEFRAEPSLPQVKLDPRYVDYMNRNVDWDTENLINYDRREA